jgi:hypothetical protein
MANIDELEAQVDEAKKRLAEMETQLQNAKGGGDEEIPMEDQSEDAAGQEEVPVEESEPTFADRVEERMSPAEEVKEQDSTPQVDKVMIGIKMEDKAPEEGPSVNMDMLYQIVYDEPYDASDASAEGKMRMMVDAMEDPRVKAMAKEDPEKFALYMYGRTSAIG